MNIIFLIQLLTAGMTTIFGMFIALGAYDDYTDLGKNGIDLAGMVVGSLGFLGGAISLCTLSPQ
jgi:hypothetical protein